MHKGKVVISAESLKSLLGLSEEDVIRNVSLDYASEDIQIELATKESIYDSNYEPTSFIPRQRVGLEYVAETDSYRLPLKTRKER